MADTVRGDFSDKFCADCGHKGCYIKHYGPLCPDSSVGYFDQCFSERGASRNHQPKPFTYNCDTGLLLNSEPTIVAGLNIYSQPQLFMSVAGSLRPMTQADWLNIIDQHKAVATEMLAVQLSKQL